MEFELDFNRKSDDATLLKIGGRYKDEQMFIELNTYEDLKAVLDRLNEVEPNSFYSAVISYDPPTLYFDKDV